MKLRGSRRLTGPNLLWEHPGALIQVGVASGDLRHAIEAWRRGAGEILEAVGWGDERTAVRRFHGGADLAISAPIDGLYAACRVNEWAWEAACAALQEREAPSLEQAARRLAGLIEKERNPRLLALQSAATERGLGFLWDDDLTSVGMGEGSRTWPTKDLPEPTDVDWAGVHDVPVLLVTGTNGKTTTVRMLASIARAAGRTPGFCTTDWIRVGDEIVDEGDWSGPGAARQVLRHPKTQIAILEVARGGMLRRGLGVVRADAAAVLNVTDDHLGEFGVDDRETLIETKFVIRRALAPHSPLILNAEDEGVRRRGRKIDAKVTWFALDRRKIPDDAAAACIVQNGALTLIEEDLSGAVVPVDEVPATFGGAARFNVSNALAALGLAAAIDIPLPAIAQGLRDFQSSPDLNPGRGNLFELGGVTVIVDFAHNPHGIAALLEMAGAMPARRRLLTLGQGGDRTDDAIRDLARVAWEARPDRIILKEMQKYLRGRSAGEVVDIMERELRVAGAPSERLGRAASEMEAVTQALEWAEEGDLLLFSLQAERDAALELLTSLQASGWKPGAPLP